MPLAVLGTAEYHFGQAVKQVQLGLSVGFVAIDTAHDFPYDQKSVGKALNGVDRDSYFLITKVPGGHTKEETAQHLEEDLKQLGLDYVDLVLIHHPIKQAQAASLEASVQAQWSALEDFYRAGKARAIGVSNFCARVLDAVFETATVPPAVNQVLYHAGMGDDPDGVVSHNKLRNVTLQAFSSIDEGNPALTKGEPYASIGKKYNKSAVQVALRWLVQHETPVSYVAASNKEQYLREDLDVFDFELTAEDMAAVSAAKHCQAGGASYPCKPYWPGSEGCNECCCTKFPAITCCCSGGPMV